MDVDISGDLIADILNLIKGLFLDDVIKEARKAGQDAARDALQDALDNILETFPLTQRIPETRMGIDYSLTSNPKVRSDHLELHIDGTLFNVDTGESHPAFKPAPMPCYSSAHRYVQFYLSDYVFNTGLEALHTSHFFEYTITSAILPDDFPIELDTNTFGELLPGLKEKYPESRPMQFAVATSEVPHLQLTHTAGTGSLSGTCHLLVLQEDGKTLDDVVTIHAKNLTFTIEARVDPPALYGNITYVHLEDLDYYNSTIGEVPVDDLLSFFNVLIDMALPEINEMILSEGLILPTIEGISFGNAELGFDPDYLEVGVTPIYNWVHLRQVMKRPRPGKAAKKLVIT